MLASAGGIIHSLCFLIIGVPLWAIGRRNGYRTQIQFFRERLDSRLIGFLLFPILVTMVVTYLLVGVVAAGAVVSEVTKGAFESQGWFEAAGFGVPTSVASGVICAVVLIYVFFGGMRGTAWANALQTCFFMVLGLVTFVTIANALGGTDNFLENLKLATSKVPESHLGRAKLTYAKYFSFLLIPLSVAMFPHVFQHWLTARSARTFKAPIILHPIFIMIGLGTMCVDWNLGKRFRAGIRGTQYGSGNTCSNSRNAAGRRLTDSWNFGSNHVVTG